MDTKIKLKVNKSVKRRKCTFPSLKIEMFCTAKKKQKQFMKKQKQKLRRVLYVNRENTTETIYMFF